MKKTTAIAGKMHAFPIRFNVVGQISVGQSGHQIALDIFQPEHEGYSTIFPPSHIRLSGIEALEDLLFNLKNAVKVYRDEHPKEA